MTRVLKPIISFLMFLVVLFFIATILIISTELPEWGSAAIALTAAIWVGYNTWRLVDGGQIGTSVAVICGALIVGGLGFIVGFLGPMVLAKDTSQGPLFGIFIMAPLGVILGAIGGYIFASRQPASAVD